MTVSKKAIFAVFLCFVFGPFALGYVNKKAGLLLSVLMTLTIVVGFGAVIAYSSAHPPSPDDIARLQAGQYPDAASGLGAIFYPFGVAIVIEWVASMVWAYISAKADEK